MHAVIKGVSNLSSAYHACVLSLDFQLLEIKADVAKESNATVYVLDRFICKWVFVVNQLDIDSM